ncbi:MAG: PQQ-dependent dehydrogenase, methanol/ethanol family [Bryobacteraceae bacterium]
MRITKLACLACHASLLIAQVSDRQLLEASSSNWLHYNGSYDSRRHSPLNEVNLANVDSLVAQWIFRVPGATRLQSVPIVADGVMYVTQPNEVYALDARSGRQIWEYHRIPARQKGPNRGVAVWGDKVYFTTPDAYLVALNAASGNVMWESKLAEASDGYWSPAAPLVVNGKVISGIAPGDHGLNGYLYAHDAITGERLWRFHSIPLPGEPGSETWSGDSWKTGGGNTWLTGSYDPELNLLYWGIGNPAPDFNGDVRIGDNLYTESVVALDLNTGKMKWYFQFTPHDTMDWDAVEIPVLVDAVYQGKMRKLMAHADRNGFYYLLDRVTGEFLMGTPFVHQLNWASGLTAKGRPIRVPGIEPSLKGTKVCPAAIGAANWMSPAFNQDTGLFYVVALEGCGMANKGTETFRPGGFQYRATGDMNIRDETWKLYVRALDLTTGKLKWESERIGSTGFGGGLLSTAGGLIFSGEAGGQFVALDAKTGKTVWHFNTGQSITSQPITYSIQGKQRVALTAGADVISFGLFESGKDAAR